MSVVNILISVDGFVGQFSLAKSVELNKIIQSFIDKYEKKYILQLLGVELGELFIADLENVSQEDRFVYIQDAFYLQEENNICCSQNGGIRISDGMEAILYGLIYYQYIRQTQTRSGQAGISLGQAEVSTVQSSKSAVRNAEVRWNSVLGSIEAIQCVCRNKVDDSSGELIYPEYKGVRFNPQYNSFL